MAQLFKRRTNTFIRAALTGCLLLLFGGGGIGIAAKWSTWQTEVNVPIEQSVPFSHRHHVGGLGIDCRYCHASVMKSAFAGLPPTHVCMTCHSQIWQDAPMLEPVRQSLATGKPLIWQRVHRLPKYVYFDHSIHVNHGVGCSSCHGQIDRMPQTWQTRTFYMRDCLSCHREPEKQLRPHEAVFDLDWQAPPEQDRLGAKLVQRYHIPKARLTDCNTCHR